MRSVTGFGLAISVVALGLACGACHATHAVDRKSPLTTAAIVKRAPVAADVESGTPSDANGKLATRGAATAEVPSRPPGHEDSHGLSWKDVWLILLGAVVSLYVTVVFERYNRFGELMRRVARARQHFEGHPGSTAEAQLKRSRELSVEFFRLLDETEWSLNAEGHYDAAAGVGRLKGFIFRAVACIENMIAGKTKGLPLDQYLSLVTIEYAEAYNKDFVAFERKLRPSLPALLRPYPHPVLPTKATAVIVNYFDKLL